MKLNIFPLFPLFVAIYNIWYGAICWEMAGFIGLLVGSIFMIIGTIVGVMLK